MLPVNARVECLVYEARWGFNHTRHQHAANYPK